MSMLVLRPRYTFKHFLDFSPLNLHFTLSSRPQFQECSFFKSAFGRVSRPQNRGQHSLTPKTFLLMAKEITGYVKLQCKGGQANPAPPIGPALGSKGVNIMEFCKQFNARTQDKMGKTLPVLITVFADKSFDFVIKTPPAAVQLLELSKVAKGSKESNRQKVGKVTWAQIEEIAKDKMPDLNCFTVESAMKMVAGTARSMGLTVEGQAPFNA